ncbi:MAG: hypothetical protein JNL47_05385 [Bacteroidia bacterium]|nr:hypothetical protein [Bacteroidia bacterium]
MKTRLLIFLILSSHAVTQAQIIAPQWDHVGPLSTNEPNVSPSHPDYNAFRSGRIDDLAVNPGNPNHIVAGSFFAGIWENNNRLLA